VPMWIGLVILLACAKCCQRSSHRQTSSGYTRQSEGTDSEAADAVLMNAAMRQAAQAAAQEQAAQTGPGGTPYASPSPDPRPMNPPPGYSSWHDFGASFNQSRSAPRASVSPTQHRTFDCPRCSASGRMQCYRCRGSGVYAGSLCTNCGGYGSRPCTGCNGTGRMTQNL
jgi:hypothetical protein